MKALVIAALSAIIIILLATRSHAGGAVCFVGSPRAKAMFVNSNTKAFVEKTNAACERDTK
jgi:hypothetical protein